MIQNIQNAYTPYRKEALYCLIIDIVVAVSIVLLLLLARAGWFILLILPIFALCTFFLNYLPMLRVRTEARGELFKSETLEIVDIKESRSAVGYWGTVLKESYPKALRIGKYKIACRDAQGQKIMLQCVMSEQKRELLREGIDRKQLTACTVIYGKYSHIIQAYDGCGPLIDALNQKL